jgi:hypothetical protein
MERGTLMPWGKMDDKFHRNRKVRELRRMKGGRAALGDWSFWWSWCLDDPELTGVVPAAELDATDRKSAALLVQVGLWDEAEGGYRFHDFDEYNPSREQIEAKRSADRERVANKRAAGRDNVARDTDANPARVASTRDPIPSHPIPEEAAAAVPIEPDPDDERYPHEPYGGLSLGTVNGLWHKLTEHVHSGPKAVAAFRLLAEITARKVGDRDAENALRIGLIWLARAPVGPVGSGRLKSLTPWAAADRWSNDLDAANAWWNSGGREWWRAQHPEAAQ